MYRLCLFSISCALFAQTKADLILRNGHVITLEAKNPVAESIAIQGQRILAVGTNAQMQTYQGPSTNVLDLHGALTLPGFIEGHAHFMGVGEAKMTLNLRDARNWDEIVAMVDAAAKKAPAGAWIIGRGFHQSKWDKTPEPNVQGFPFHTALTQAAPGNPVWVTHASGHAAIVNAAAMKQAGISKATPNPPGGQILRDANGEPTGALLEAAARLVAPAYEAYLARRSPAEAEADARKKVELASQEALTHGITSFQDAGSSFETVDLFKKMAEEGSLGVRLWVMLNESPERLARQIDRYRIQDAGQYHLTVRAIKQYMDGALGSRGAWLLEPYSDLPASTGLNTEPVADIRKVAGIAASKGFQLCVHAIGDRANREVLNLYEAAFADHPGPANRRWRIEHAQHLNPADIPRFAKLGVIASMQPIHCTSDAPFVIARLGQKRAAEGAYVWRSLLDHGAVVTSGTDAPVEELDPFANFHAAVTRKLKDGTLFFPLQRLAPMEELRAYTLNNAYAAFEEDLKGSLRAGKLADIVVLSKDILTVNAEEIPSTRVLFTIVGGKVLYQGH